MKDQILFLDLHDDFLSARDKMGWIKTERLLLVWPAGQRVLSRKLDLVLMQRHATTLGASLALVTVDPELRAHAAELGLPFFETVQQGHRSPWRTRKPNRLPLSEVEPPGVRVLPEPPLPFPQFPPVRAFINALGRFLEAGLFLVALLAMIGAALVILPSATIRLVPQVQEIRVIVPVVADPSQLLITPGAPLPAREVFIEIEAALRAPTSGVVQAPSSRATGFVVFSNLLGQPVRIPRGTGARTTSGLQIRFVTTFDAELPAIRGASISMHVEAVDPGPIGNVAAHQINAVDGPLALQVAVVNAEATTGGGVEQRAAVTQEDQDRLREQMLAQLEQSALAEIQARLNPSDLLAPESLQISNVLSETYDRFPGEQADSLGLTMRVRAVGLAVDESLARELALGELAGQVGPDQQLLSGSEVFTRLTEPVVDAAGRVAFEAMATGKAARRFEPSQIKEVVRGLLPKEAARRLVQTYPLQGEPAIAIWPEWFPRLPFLALRIQVTIENPLD